MQKLINLTLSQLFYSITFLVQKTLLSREKVCLRIKNGRFRTPRVDKVAVAAVPCVFSVRMANKHCFCPADGVLAASGRLPGGPWHPPAAFGGCLGAPVAPGGCLGAPVAPGGCLVAPGGPWRPLAAPGGCLGAPGAPGSLWRLLAAAWVPPVAPGCCLAAVVPLAAAWVPLVAAWPLFSFKIRFFNSRFRCSFTGDRYRISLLAVVLQCWRLEKTFLLHWCSVLCVSGGSLAFKIRFFDSGFRCSFTRYLCII